MRTRGLIFLTELTEFRQEEHEGLEGDNFLDRINKINGIFHAVSVEEKLIVCGFGLYLLKSS
jgi:hypothetical protein